MRKVFIVLERVIFSGISSSTPILASVGAVFFVCSCTMPRYIYQVTSQNLPSLQKKGDIQADVFYSTGGPGGESNSASDSYSRGVDGNLSIAVANHWAITASLGYRWERRIFDGYSDIFGGNIPGSDTKYYRMNWEAGGGYFTSIHPKKKIWLQVFAGAGAGRYSMDDYGKLLSSSTISRYRDADILRFYLNPAVHFYPNDRFIIAIGAKLTNIKYSEIRSDMVDYDLHALRLAGLEGKTITMFEPCADLKLRLPKAEFIVPHMQIGFSSQLEDYDIRNFNFSIGLTILTPPKRKRN